MIGIMGASITITINYNSSRSITRSIPYWTTSVFSSTVTDLVLVYESVTSSASVVRWVALHSWTLNWTTELPSESAYDWIIELPYECRMIELSWTELIFRRPEYRPPPRTVRVILFFRCHETCLPNHCPAMDYSLSVRCSGNMCLASRWLAMDIHSGSTIPIFRRHVTVLISCWLKYNFLSSLTTRLPSLQFLVPTCPRWQSARRYRVFAWAAIFFLNDRRVRISILTEPRYVKFIWGSHDEDSWIYHPLGHNVVQPSKCLPTFLSNVQLPSLGCPVF
jgi:hypothetical protein